MPSEKYRVYLRHPKQRVTEKTVTCDRAVADMALRHLVVSHVGEQAAAVVSGGGKQLQYVWLDENHRACERCNYHGPFIDGGETCPNCVLVQ